MQWLIFPHYSIRLKTKLPQKNGDLSDKNQTEIDKCTSSSLANGKTPAMPLACSMSLKSSTGKWSREPRHIMDPPMRRNYLSSSILHFYPWGRCLHMTGYAYILRIHGNPYLPTAGDQPTPTRMTNTTSAALCTRLALRLYSRTQSEPNCPPTCRKCEWDLVATPKVDRNGRGVRC